MNHNHNKAEIEVMELMETDSRSTGMKKAHQSTDEEDFPNGKLQTDPAKVKIKPVKESKIVKEKILTNI